MNRVQQIWAKYWWPRIEYLDNGIAYINRNHNIVVIIAVDPEATIGATYASMPSHHWAKKYGIEINESVLSEIEDWLIVNDELQYEKFIVVKDRKLMRETLHELMDHDNTWFNGF